MLMFLGTGMCTYVYAIDFVICNITNAGSYVRENTRETVDS